MAHYQLDQALEDAIFGLTEVDEISEPVDDGSDGIYDLKLLEPSESARSRRSGSTRSAASGFDRWLDGGARTGSRLGRPGVRVRRPPPEPMTARRDARRRRAAPAAAGIDPAAGVQVVPAAGSPRSRSTRRCRCVLLAGDADRADGTGPARAPRARGPARRARRALPARRTAAARCPSERARPLGRALTMPSWPPRDWLVPALDPVDNLASPHGMAAISARLRAPDGCPWDRRQTHLTPATVPARGGLRDGRRHRARHARRPCRGARRPASSR